MALKVQDQSLEVMEMAAAWGIVEALMGGTAAMRRAGITYLPKWPGETEEGYAARILTATLFPALARTTAVMVGKPFAKQLTLGDDTPDRIRTWADNIDRLGNSIHSFSADVMTEALGYGLCGVLVDYPKVGNAAKTIADEKTLSVRPYAVFIRHQQILGWQADIVDGQVILKQLRIAETHSVPDGPYGVAIRKRVRVLTPGYYEIWEQSDKDADYLLVEGNVTSLQTIPFVPFYGRKKDFMCGSSPLLDLAYLNVKHFQSQSDQDTILHVARVPILAVLGVDDDANWQLTVGASTAVKLPTGGDMKFVEHSGAAIAAGEISLEKLENQMIQTGAELLVIKPGEQKSATQSNNDAEANKSDLQRIVELFEDSLDQVLQLFADWIKEEQGGHASLFKDFSSSSLSDASAQLVLAMQTQGLITKKTAIIEQQRRGMLSPDIEPDDELAEVEAEGPPLGSLMDPTVDPLTGLPKDKTNEQLQAVRAAPAQSAR